MANASERYRCYLLLLTAVLFRCCTGIAIVGRSSADLPQLAVRVSTHFDLGLQTVIIIKNKYYHHSSSMSCFFFFFGDLVLNKNSAFVLPYSQCG